jgi:dTDP-4-dehydrorhamnose 3,5-epimerase
MSAHLELLPDTWLFQRHRFQDHRGLFVKTMTRTLFSEAGLSLEFAEEFYSVSRRDVIRGMHFQAPPKDHVKLVYCPAGAVLDVLLDLRSGPGYGRFASVILSADDPHVLVIPKGIAHGFKSLTNDSMLIYKTSTEYAPSYDRGLRWDSFGFDWGDAVPVLSDRDRTHPEFSTFDSPF